jgi:hypothetical protein
MKSRRKTGEKPRVRKPLKIDRLPVEMRDRIQAERGAGRTWPEIEEMSPTFEEWGKVPDAVKKLFPDRFLPHSTLARWWDLRVDQVRGEVMKQAEAAKGLAVAFAGRGFDQLPEAVMNALRDTIFSLLEYSDEKSKGKAIKALAELGWLVNDQQKLQLKGRQVEAETKRVQLLEREFDIRKRKFDEETDKAARKLGKGQRLTTDDINRIRERTFGLPPIQRSAPSDHSAA